MSCLTSIAGSVLLCALIGALTNQHYSWFILSCAAFGSQLPHLLERPWLIERLGPQTLTHSLLGILSIGVLFSPLLLVAHSSLLTALLIGYLAHLLLDAATEHGVLLFYPSRLRAVLPRHPLHRIISGSPRETLLRRWLLGLWLLALPLNAVGMRGVLHQLLPVAQFAVEDYLTASGQGRSVFVQFLGRFTTSQRLIAGRWEVLDAPSSTSLLVEDPQGRRYTLGPHPQNTIQAVMVRARKGAPLTVQSHLVRLHDQLLADALSTIPATGRTYLIGVLKTPEPVSLPILLDQFQPILAGSSQVELRYATWRDLHEQHLTGLYVTDGTLLLRTLTESSRRSAPPQTVSPLPAALIPSETSHRTVSLTVRHLYEAQELLVHPEQDITQGQLLADLRTYRAALLTDRALAAAHYTAAQTALEQVRLTHHQELVFKRTEDMLAGTHRMLTSVLAQHATEHAHAQAAVDAATATLAQLDHALATTTMHAPVSGRILTVRVHSSTATIRLLVHEH